MSIDGGITHLASYAGNELLFSLAGLFFAGAVYRYSKGGDAERLLYGGVAALMCSGLLRALEGFVQHTGPNGSVAGITADSYVIALQTLVSYVGNVVLPMYALTQLASMCVHLGGASDHVYPGSTWLRKLFAAVGCCMVSGILSLAEYFVKHTHAVGP